MSQENVEIVQRWIASMNAADKDKVFALASPDIEWRDQMHAPDVPETLYGIAALEQLAAQWEAAYDSLTVEVLEYLDFHPWVICISRWEATTNDDLTVEVRSVDAYEIEDGRIKRSWGGYPNLNAAQDALGLGD